LFLPFIYSFGPSILSKDTRKYPLLESILELLEGSDFGL
jgi:hypothetical protein